MPSKHPQSDSDSSGPDEKLAEYEYSDLTARNSIRILNLNPAKRRKRSEIQPEIVCELLETNLDDIGFTYEAVSWAWGTPELDPWVEKIRIATKGEEDFFFRLPSNLVAALRALRYPQYSRKLWIDAICIDQKHTDEKNKQVPMMSRIYRGAERVCIWLGSADSDSKMALDFIKNEVLKLQGFDELCDNQDASPKWAAMLNLMKRSWFSRRWVVQEIALARDAIIYCGKDSISWKDFADAVQLFVEVETATHRLSEVMKKDPQFYHIPGWFEYVSALGASLLVDATGTIYRTSKDETRSPLLSLEYLVSFLSVFEVTEPRDAIYSLLAIAKDTNPVAVVRGPTKSSVPAEASLQGLGRNLSRIPYKVDYEKPFIDICKEFISFSIQQSLRTDPTRALDILCRPWAPVPKQKKPMTGKTNGSIKGKHVNEFSDKEEKMPSWIPKLRGAAFAMFPHTNGEVKMGRKNADPLVGLPIQSQRNYSAAEVKKVNMSELWFKKREDYYSMFVTGFVLEKVQTVERPSQSGNIPEEWISLGGWDDFTNADPPEEFWRTLVGDRGRLGKNPPTYYARACKESITKGIASGSLNTTELINDGRCSVVSEFFRRVQAVIWNRTLMQTDSGRLGIVRKDVQKGDLVCILFGCSVPVILRRLPKINFAEEQMVDDEEFIKAAIWIQRRWRTVRSTPSGEFEIEREIGGRGGKSPEPTGAVNEHASSSDRSKFPSFTPQANGAGSHSNNNSIPKAKSKPKVKPKPDLKLNVNDGLYNSSSPRTPKLAEEQKRYYYEFIGECYVHGMMDGEAIKHQNSEHIKEQVFELR